MSGVPVVALFLYYFVIGGVIGGSITASFIRERNRSR